MSPHGRTLTCWLKGVLLVAAVIFAYQPAWHAGFIWDDDAYVTSNPLLTVTGIRPGAAVRQEVQVQFSSKATPGVYDERAFLTLDTPGHPELEIRVAASLR